MGRTRWDCVLAASAAFALAASPQDGGDEALKPYRPAGEAPAFGGGPACLAAGTLVATPEGESPIERLRPGDPVISVDERTGRLSPVRVAASHRRAAAATLELKTASGARLLATAEHPLFEAGSGAYREAGALRPGMRLAAPGPGGLAGDPVASVSPGPSSDVFDLSVGGPWRNFVANGLLVHNKGRGAADPEVISALRRKAAAAAAAARTQGLRVVPMKELRGKGRPLAGKRVAILGIPRQIYVTAPVPHCELQADSTGENLHAVLARLPRPRLKRMLQLGGEDGVLLLATGVLRPDVAGGRPEELFLEVESFQELGPVPPGTGSAAVDDILRPEPPAAAPAAPTRGPAAPTRGPAAPARRQAAPRAEDWGIASPN